MFLSFTIASLGRKEEAQIYEVLQLHEDKVWNLFHLTVRMGVGAAHCGSFVFKDLNPSRRYNWKLEYNLCVFVCKIIV